MLEDAGVAHIRARLLLRQHRSLRARYGHPSRGAGVGPPNGDRLGELRASPV